MKTLAICSILILFTIFSVTTVTPYAYAEEKTVLIGNIDVTNGVLEGSPNASITIVEFGDFQCPKCNQWFQNEKPSIESKFIENGKVNLYFLDVTWLGDDSVIAAQASYCAEDQGMYWEYHDKLYDNQAGVEDGWASADNLKTFAYEIKLDAELFNECLDSGKYADRVAFNKEVGASNGIDRTPVFLIVSSDGTTKRINGPQPSTVFDKIIDTLLDEAMTQEKLASESVENKSETEPLIDPPSLKFDDISEDKSTQMIPEWVRNNADWWAQGAIGDSDFISGIQYLIKEGIMQIPATKQGITTEDSAEIPAWIKNNADWWAKGLISDDDFVKGIQFLVEQGIIHV